MCVCVCVAITNIICHQMYIYIKVCTVLLPNACVSPCAGMTDVSAMAVNVL